MLEASWRCRRLSMAIKKRQKYGPSHPVRILTMFELVGQTKEGRPLRQRDVIDEGHSEIQGKLISSARLKFRLLRQLHAPILNLVSEPQA